MATSTSQTPIVHIDLSINPASYSFSQTSPPTLTLTITSRAKTPITVFTWRTPLALPSALTSNNITIIDASSGQVVQTSSILVNRAPFKRTRGTQDEAYFITLEPNTPLQLSTGFGRGGSSVKPQPKAVVERGYELDAHGNERNIRRSRFAAGVDGLEPGHEYVVGLNREALERIWWAPVSKEEVLVDGIAEGSYVQDYEWKETPLDFHVKEARVSVEQ